MSGPSFGFRWNPIQADIDWQLTQTKGLGAGISEIGKAVDTLANATRQQNTNDILLQIAQANDIGALKGSNVLGGIDPNNRTVDQRAVLDAFNTRKDMLGLQQAQNMVNDYQLRGTTDNNLITEQTELAGIEPQYLGPLAQLTATNRANAIAAAQQERVNKREDIKTATDVAKANSEIKLRDVQIGETLYKNQGTRKVDWVLGEDGEWHQQVTTTPSLSDIVGGTSKAGNVALSPEQQGNMDTTWKALKANGVSDAAATFLMGEIGREGSFNNANIYGNHSDPKAGRTNSGIISWSDPGRRKAFLADMKANGHLNADGSMKQTPEALTAQVNFMVKEMKQSYPDAYKALQRNDLTDAEADKLFGGNYIGWARNNPAFSAQGYQNRSDFLGAAASRYGSKERPVNTSGEVDNPFGEGSKPAMPSSAKGQSAKILQGVGFDPATVREAQMTMKATLEAENVKHTMSKARPTAVEQTALDDFLKKEGYLDNEIFSRNGEIYRTIKNFDAYNMMTPKEKQDTLKWLSDQNQDGAWLYGRITPAEIKKKILQRVSDQKHDKLTTEKQKRFEALNTAATKLYQSNVSKFPNITMEDAREMVDAKLAKEYEALRKKSS